MQGSIVIIDSNENMHHSEHSLKFLEMGALTKVEKLPYDFEVLCQDGSIIAIERKTPRDLLDSIKDRRLFNQVTAMVEKTKWCYLLVEGNFINRHNMVVLSTEYMDITKWVWPSLQGALLSIQELGCSIIYDHDFHGAVERIVNRSRNDVKIAPRRVGYVFSEAETILMSLPNIGSKKARKILKEFNGNVAMAISILTSPHDGKTNQLEGWGKTSRDNLVKALGGRLEVFFDEC